MAGSRGGDKILSSIPQLSLRGQVKDPGKYPFRVSIQCCIGPVECNTHQGSRGVKSDTGKAKQDVVIPGNLTGVPSSYGPCGLLQVLRPAVVAQAGPECQDPRFRGLIEGLQRGEG